MKNYFHSDSPELIAFCQEAREFFDYLQKVDRSNLPKDEYIERPYAMLMHKDLAEFHGLDTSIFRTSEYLGDFIRYLWTDENKPSFPAHIDSSFEGTMPACLNFPLVNCDETTVVRWLRIESGSPKKVVNKGGEINSKIAANLTYETRDCNTSVVEEVSFFDDQPHLFRTSRWHEVINNGPKRRLISSIPFKSSMIWEDIVHHCKTKGLI